MPFTATAEGPREWCTSASTVGRRMVACEDWLLWLVIDQTNHDSIRLPMSLRSQSVAEGGRLVRRKARVTQLDISFLRHTTHSSTSAPLHLSLSESRSQPAAQGFGVFSSPPRHATYTKFSSCSCLTPAHTLPQRSLSTMPSGQGSTSTLPAAQPRDWSFGRLT